MKAMLAGITFFLLLLGAPSRTGRLHFIQLTTAVSISAERSHPPYIAFAETERKNGEEDFKDLVAEGAQELTTESVKPLQTLSAELISLAQQDVMQLQAMIISKPVRGEVEEVDNSWMNELTPSQKVRLGEARDRAEILSEDWSLAANDVSAQISQKAIEQIRQSLPVPVSAETNESSAQIGEPVSEVRIAAIDDRSQTPSEIDPLISQNAVERIRQSVSVQHPSETAEASVAQIGEPAREVKTMAPQLGNDEVEIHGKFVLTGGLGYTNDHHFEVRRRQEGIHEEQGTVDMRSTSYAIRVRGHSGEVVVRLRDQRDHLLGEASFHLADLVQKSGRIEGPLLSLKPAQDSAGRFVSAYSPNKVRLTEPKATAISGAMPLTIAKNGEFEFDRLQKGSFTLMSATAKNHLRTLAMVPAGFRSDLPLFPQSMVQSLRQIVSDQRQMNLNDPEAPLVWGRALLNGKVLAGVHVEMESAPGSEAIYFNELLLPDPKLKATSANGLFAFINVPEGLHALLGRRGEAYFSHQNVVTERGSMSVGDLVSSLKTEQARLRVFDAFTGEPQAAQIIHQGIEEEIAVGANGVFAALIPHEHRLSFIQVGPQPPYSAATYQADDADGYVHFPLVRGDWLNYLRVSLKLDDSPGSATVVGFVPNEGFTADAVEEGGHARIVYFDAQGRPLQGKQGVAGGGFVIFGLGEGVREITVIGETSGLVSTRVIGADPQSLNVLLFRSE